MPDLTFDLARWPVWILFTLLAINIFKDSISSLLVQFFPTAIREHFRYRAERKADREEHEQSIEATVLSSRLSRLEREQQRKSWREEQWVELIQQMQAWAYETLDKRLDGIQKGNDRSATELAQLRTNSVRANDLLTALNGNLTRLADILERRDERE